jgi:hypothetical protein
MYAIYLMLFLGAFFFFAFTAIFVAGSMIQLASMARGVLRSRRGNRDLNAEARRSAAPSRQGSASRAAPAEIRADVGAAYACA